jgi:hypothetical protein
MYAFESPVYMIEALADAGPVLLSTGYLANTERPGTIAWARHEYGIESPVDFRWNVIEKAYDLESATLTEVINAALDEDDLITRAAAMRNLKGRDLARVNLSHIEWQVEQMDEYERSLKRAIRKGVKVDAARRQLRRVWQITDLLNDVRCL